MIRHDIRIKREQLGSSRIKQHKDFHSMQGRYLQKKRKRNNKRISLGIVGVLVIIIIVLTWLQSKALNQVIINEKDIPTPHQSLYHFQ